MSRGLILASSSRYRAELLSRLGLPFERRRPDVDETPRPDEDAEALVARLARSKAEAVAGGFPGALVIGSDQAAASGGKILGKPGTAARAREQLVDLSGRYVTFFTSVYLLDAGCGQCRLAVVPTRVRFRTLSSAEIERYVAREQPLDCAGAFKSEGLGIALFDAIDSEDPTALIGLPLIALCRMLREAGVEVIT